MCLLSCSNTWPEINSCILHFWHLVNNTHHYPSWNMIMTKKHQHYSQAIRHFCQLRCLPLFEGAAVQHTCLLHTNPYLCAIQHTTNILRIRFGSRFWMGFIVVGFSRIFAFNDTFYSFLFLLRRKPLKIWLKASNVLMMYETKNLQHQQHIFLAIMTLFHFFGGLMVLWTQSHFEKEKGILCSYRGDS